MCTPNGSHLLTSIRLHFIHHAGAGHAKVRGPSTCRSLSPQASSLELKQEWVRSIRQVIQERRGHLRGALREPIPLPKTPNPTLGRQRSISRRSAHRNTVNKALLDAFHHVICQLSKVKLPSGLWASVLMVVVAVNIAAPVRSVVWFSKAAHQAPFRNDSIYLPCSSWSTDASYNLPDGFIHPVCYFL